MQLACCGVWGSTSHSTLQHDLGLGVHHIASASMQASMFVVPADCATLMLHLNLGIHRLLCRCHPWWRRWSGPAAACSAWPCAKTPWMLRCRSSSPPSSLQSLCLTSTMHGAATMHGCAVTVKQADFSAALQADRAVHMHTACKARYITSAAAQALLIRAAADAGPFSQGVWCAGLQGCCKRHPQQHSPAGFGPEAEL